MEPKRRNLVPVPVRRIATAHGRPLRPAVQRPPVVKRSPPPAGARSIKVESGVLSVMATQQVFLAEFPFLKALAAAKAACQTCSGRRAYRPVLEAAKQRLAATSPAQRARLKQLLKVEKVTIEFRMNGQRHVVEF